MKLIIATLSIVFLVLPSGFVHASMAADAIMKPIANIDCGSKCAVRCSKSGHDYCLKYCHICCKECSCVPSGTYGHKDECPCYRDWKNSKGNPKCP